MVLIRRLGDRQSRHPAGSCCLRWLEPRAVPSRVFSGPNCTPVPCREHRSPQDHQGTSDGIRDTFVCHNWGPPVIWWVEATDASTPPQEGLGALPVTPRPKPRTQQLGPCASENRRTLHWGFTNFISRLSTFVLFSAGNVPVTCLCWEVLQCATKRSPSMCWSQDGLRRAPRGPPRASQHSVHPREDRLSPHRPTLVQTQTPQPEGLR